MQSVVFDQYSLTPACPWAQRTAGEALAALAGVDRVPRAARHARRIVLRRPVWPAARRKVGPRPAHLVHACTLGGPPRRLFMKGAQRHSSRKMGIIICSLSDNMAILPGNIQHSGRLHGVLAGGARRVCSAAASTHASLLSTCATAGLAAHAELDQVCRQRRGNNARHAAEQRVVELQARRARAVQQVVRHQHGRRAARRDDWHAPRWDSVHHLGRSPHKCSEQRSSTYSRAPGQ